MALSAFWKKFVEDYGANEDYWFFPKGRQVDTPEFGKIVSVFSDFDGKPWDPAAILARLRKEKLSRGDAAVPRMIKRAIENMGLCVIDEKQGIFLTPLGRLFLDEGQDPRVLERHLWRYRFPNPLSPRAAGIKLTPHVFLVQVMLASDNHLSHDEFILFVARARQQEDFGVTVRRIAAWRRLQPAAQAEIKAALPGLYDTIAGDSSYAMGFHRCGSYIIPETRPGDRPTGMSLDPARIAWLRTKAAEKRVLAPHIDNAAATDWIASFGGTEDSPSIENPVDYYLDISEPAKAVAAFKRLPPEARRGLTVKEFRRAAFLEKDLEDFLATRLHLIEPGLQAEWGGRQVKVGVGSMDLFARAGNGDLVVIELKKVRASDKVFGQICRYMGWIKAHYAAGRSVRGYIVATEMDERLRYAARVVPAGRVKMKTFHRDDAAGIFIAD